MIVWLEEWTLASCGFLVVFSWFGGFSIFLPTKRCQLLAGISKQTARGQIIYMGEHVETKSFGRSPWPTSSRHGSNCERLAFGPKRSEQFWPLETSRSEKVPTEVLPPLLASFRF